MVSMTQRDILQTIADIQQTTAVHTIEDIQLAEEAGLELNLVQHSLEALAREGYVRLGRAGRLSGRSYTVSLLPTGNTLVGEFDS